MVCCDFIPLRRYPNPMSLIVHLKKVQYRTDILQLPRFVFLQNPCKGLMGVTGVIQAFISSMASRGLSRVIFGPTYVIQDVLDLVFCVGQNNGSKLDRNAFLLLFLQIRVYFYYFWSVSFYMTCFIHDRSHKASALNIFPGIYIQLTTRALTELYTLLIQVKQQNQAYISHSVLSNLNYF